MDARRFGTMVGAGIVASGFGVLGIAACGSNGDTPSVGAADGAVLPDGALQPDGAPFGGGGGAGGASGGGAGGGGGTAGAGGGGGAGGTGGGCPTYQTSCNGACIPTSQDPKNCGGCNVACDVAGGKVCSAGACAGACFPGLTGCSGACVDTDTDSAHCGSCNNACGAGKGCAAGVCIDVIKVGPSPAACTGGGAPIAIDNGGTKECLGNLAEKTFRWGLCSCGDLHASAALDVDAFDSTKGPLVKGGLGGGVGVNKMYGMSSSATISGSLWASGATGIAMSAKSSVGEELHSGGNVSTSNALDVGGVAFVNGSVLTSNSITIGGALHVPATAIVAPGVHAASVVKGPVTVPDPCDCAPAQLIPVTAIVKAHAGTNNDNSSIGLDANVFTAAAAPLRLDLPCGNYYLTKIQTSHPLVIAAHGQTALYIDGDVSTSQKIAFVVDPTGQFDVFMSGTVASSGGLTIGSPNYPALSRTYLGSTTGLALSASSRIGGNLYEPFGLVAWSGGSDIYGSLFAGNFAASAATTIHYDTAVLTIGDDCTKSPAGPMGQPGTQCGSCRDCNNQACTGGKCGGCTSNDQCCAPLICTNGTCGAGPR